jgi:V/A-type H+-transporting ATPase subunit C
MVQVPLKDYTYANARVRAMNARLLEEHVYKELLEAADYNNTLGVLETTEYQQDIEHFMLEGARPTIIDRAFNHNLVRNFGKIKDFFEGKPEIMVQALLARWDLYNLKTIIRGMRALVPKAEIMRILVPIGSIDLIELEEIVNQPDLRGALDAIVMFGREWPINYGQAVSGALGKFLHEHDLSVLELALDKYHYEHVQELLGSDQNSDLVRQVLDMEIDAVNIVTLMRICGIEMQQATVDEYFLPGGTLSKRDFEKIMALGQPEQVYSSALAKLPYKRPLQAAWERFDERGESAFEDEMEKYIIRECMKMGKDPLGIGVIIEYMWKKYLEVTNLRIIIRGKSIGLLEGQIRKELFLMGETKEK